MRRRRHSNPQKYRLKDGGAGYLAGLHNYLIRQLRNREDAQDLAQEAYLRYLQSPNPTDVQDLSAYLSRIAFNLMTEWRLRKDRSIVSFDSELVAQQSNVTAEGPEPIEHVLRREYLERVLEQIPTSYRRVLLMSKCDGLTNAQIAQVLQVTPDTVARYLGRAVAFARRARWD